MPPPSPPWRRLLALALDIALVLNLTGVVVLILSAGIDLGLTALLVFAVIALAYFGGSRLLKGKTVFQHILGVHRRK